MMLATLEKLAPQLPKRFLIIEDEMMMVFLLDDMLSDLGYDVIGIASRFEQASEQIANESFDVAILDVNLGGKKTFGLANQLQNKQIPFIFSTGYAKKNLPEDYRHYPILQKPYSMAQLQSNLETIFKALSN